jgi:hypothetical protein
MEAHIYSKKWFGLMIPGRDWFRYGTRRLIISFTVGTSGKGLSVCIVSLLIATSILSQLSCCIDTSSPVTSASAETFVIRYCIYDNVTADTSYSTETHLDIYSNGTALYRHVSYRPSYNITKNVSSELPAVLVSESLDTLVCEGYRMLDGSPYEDSGWPLEEVNHTERVSVETPNDANTVVFSGHSMMGVIPNSYALLNNIMRLVQGRFPDMPDVALDIVVSESQNCGPLADITAHLTNSGSTTLRDSGLCNMSWPLFIISADGSTVVDLQARAIPECVMDFAPLTTSDFGPWSWNRSGLSPGKYVIMSRVVIWDCEVGDIASDLTWTPDGSQFESEDDPKSLSIAITATGMAIVASIGFYVIYAYKKGSRRRK